MKHTTILECHFYYTYCNTLELLESHNVPQILVHLHAEIVQQQTQTMKFPFQEEFVLAYKTFQRSLDRWQSGIANNSYHIDWGEMLFTDLQALQYACIAMFDGGNSWTSFPLFRDALPQDLREPSFSSRFTFQMLSAFYQEVHTYSQKQLLLQLDSLYELYKYYRYTHSPSAQDIGYQVEEMHAQYTMQTDPFAIKNAYENLERRRAFILEKYNSIISSIVGQPYTEQGSSETVLTDFHKVASIQAPDYVNVAVPLAFDWERGLAAPFESPASISIVKDSSKEDK
jgi:hypothetical protein